MKAYTASFLAPVYGAVDEQSGDLVGTGTFVRTGKGVFLLTAAHVAKKVETEYIAAGHSVGPAGRLVQFSSKFTRDDGLDVAVVHIDESTLNQGQRRAVNLADAAGCSTSIDNDLLFIHGFPGEKSRFFAMLGGVLSTTLPYSTCIGTSAYSWFDTNLHVAAEYHPDGAENLTDKVVALPDAHGLSGTALWTTCSAENVGEWAPEKARIVAVIHNWDQAAHSLVGTRIERVMEFLVRHGIA